MASLKSNTNKGENMKTILNIHTSLAAEQSQSSQLADALVASLSKQNGQTVVTRDLAAQPVPHLDGERFAAFSSDPATRTPEQQAVVDESDALIAELQNADVIVLGLPMYNFGIPSTLKAWIDHVARAGVTFRYTENGPEGLLKNKKLIVTAARGGKYLGTPKDTQTGFIKDVFGFLGITDIDFVYAEGLAMKGAREGALQSAHAEIEQQVKQLAA